MRTAGPYPDAVPDPVPAQPPTTITCVDCGDDAHLLTVSEAGEQGERIAVYRCSGCMDRWDLVFEADEDAPVDHGAGPGRPAPEGELEG
jgi:hypothetical protein